MTSAPPRSSDAAATATAAAERQGAPREGVVLLADGSDEGQRLAEALRAAGFAVVDSEASALPDRVARLRPLAVVVCLEQAHAREVIQRIRDRTPGPPGTETAILPLGRRELLRELELALSPLDRPFERPLDAPAIAAYLHWLLAGAPRRSSDPRSSEGDLSGPDLFDTDHLLADVPSMADLPELAAVFPSRGGNAPAGPRLSPEIEALLQESVRRARERAAVLPDADVDEDMLVPDELLAQLQDLLLSGPDGRRGGGEDGDGQRAEAIFAAPRPSAIEPHSANDEQARGPGEARPQRTTARPPRVTPQPRAPSSRPPEHAPAPPPPRATQPGTRQAAVRAEIPRTRPTQPGLPQHRATAHEAPQELEASRHGVLRASTSPPLAEPTHRGRRHSDTPKTVAGKPLFGEPSRSRITALPPSEPTTFRTFGRPVAVGRAPSPTPPGEGPLVPNPQARHTPGTEAHPSSRMHEPGIPATRARLEPLSLPLPFDAPDERPEQGIAAELLARAIRSRATGALTLASEDGSRVRHVLLREGDVVTAATDHPDDALVYFLARRGDLSLDLARERAGRLPTSGRHAAAALIAQGFLGQDDLWPILRAHAEWLIAAALREEPTSAQLVKNPPERLAAEPNVFGGATGSEVFVDLVRRVIHPEQAAERLGGADARIERGELADLLHEAALDEAELHLVLAARGSTLGHVTSHHPEIAPLIYALVALDVLTSRPPARQPVSDGVPSQPDPLDANAIRQRVAARMALVREGDYFALLGLDHGATSYDVRRAYLALRRSFEPAHILDADTADLADDVELILDVIEEAYEVLRDSTRRARYLRAIGAAG